MTWIQDYSKVIIRQQQVAYPNQLADERRLWMNNDAKNKSLAVILVADILYQEFHQIIVAVWQERTLQRKCKNT